MQLLLREIKTERGTDFKSGVGKNEEFSCSHITFQSVRCLIESEVLKTSIIGGLSISPFILLVFATCILVLCY